MKGIISETRRQELTEAVQEWFDALDHDGISVDYSNRDLADGLVNELALRGIFS